LDCDVAVNTGGRDVHVLLSIVTVTLLLVTNSRLYSDTGLHEVAKLEP